MADQPEPKMLTAEIDEWLAAAKKRHPDDVVRLLDYSDFVQLLEMARLALTLQRRAEEAEAKVRELETELRKKLQGEDNWLEEDELP